MRRVRTNESWVVYRMAVTGKHGKDLAANAVCERAEWDEMELARPGQQTLIRAGVLSEAEAERLAREAPGGTAEKSPRLKAR